MIPNIPGEQMQGELTKNHAEEESFSIGINIS